MIFNKKTAAIFGVAAFLAAPAFAEKERDVLYVDDHTQQRDLVIREENNRVNAIYNDYMSKMKAIEKIDNDIRYLLMESNKYTDKELQNFINKKILPRSAELLSLANEVTSRSSAIREVHEIYIDYATQRHQALAYLATYANKRVPKAQVRAMSSYSGLGSGSRYEMVSTSEDYLSDESYSITAAMRAMLASNDKLRNLYYNKRDYISRNRTEVITVEK